MAIAGNPGCARYSSENKNIFWFAIISDTHINSVQYADKENLGTFLTSTLEIVNPSFIINLGDLTDQLLDIHSLGQTQWDDYRNIVYSADLIDYSAYFDVPGNHDQYWESQNPWPEASAAYLSLECKALSLLYPQGWPRFNQPPLTFYTENSIQGEGLGRHQHSWIYKPDFGGTYHFISISTPHPDFCHPCIDGYYDSPGELNNEELSFVKDELETWKYANLTFIVGHHPEYSLDVGRFEFRSLLQNYNISAYGYGHTHEGGETATDGTLFINADSLAEHRGYAVVAVDNGGISVAHARIDEWPVVMITTPVDKTLGKTNPYVRPVPMSNSNMIRALVFDPEDVTGVTYRIDGEDWHPLSPVRPAEGGQSCIWETTQWNSIGLSPGDHTIEVQAVGTTQQHDSITVEVSGAKVEGNRYVYCDDQGLGFILYGQQANWYQNNHPQDIVYNGHAHYTVSTTVPGDTYAQWRPRLPAHGNYEIFAYIPKLVTGYPATRFARYHIQYEGGIKEVVVDQYLFNQNYGQITDRWFSLGIYPFSKGTSGFVELSGNSPGQPASIGCDALRFVRTASNSSRIGYTGWWYDPKESGTGLSIEVQEGMLFLGWCTYQEKTGEPIWYSSGGAMTDQNTYSGTVLAWTGWPLGAAYAPPIAYPVGTIEIKFLSQGQARVSWALGKHQDAAYLVRFMDDFSPGDKDTRAIHGWWVASSLPGMGIFMESQGGTLFMAWYHYRADGSPRWWSSSSDFAPGATIFSGLLREWGNGPCIGCTYQLPDPPEHPGSVIIRFDSESHATIKWPGGQINLEKFNLSP
jgi:hypothetical protein